LLLAFTGLNKSHANAKILKKAEGNTTP